MELAGYYLTRRALVAAVAVVLAVLGMGLYFLLDGNSSKGRQPPPPPQQDLVAVQGRLLLHSCVKQRPCRDVPAPPQSLLLLHGPSGTASHVAVGDGGQFTTSLPAGRYRVKIRIPGAGPVVAPPLDVSPRSPYPTIIAHKRS